jgi:hypothetical protein
MDYQKINLNSSILVLNSDYNPINICNARRAIVLLIKHKAHMVTEKVILFTKGMDILVLIVEQKNA